MVYVVNCKRCNRLVPSGVDKFPVTTIITQCVLCGEKRRYRLTEIFLGHPDFRCDLQLASRQRSSKF